MHLSGSAGWRSEIGVPGGQCSGMQTPPVYSELEGVRELWGSLVWGPNPPLMRVPPSDAPQKPHLLTRSWGAALGLQYEFL